MSEITFILGTRPEIIKLSPIMRECVKRDISYSIIHTGQHYSEYLNSVFFQQLELPQPDHNLEVGSGRHGEQTGQMVIGIEKKLASLKPDHVLVQGDTNSVLAGSIATCKMEPELGHVEAGLRSFNREMPEEHNRIVADHLGEYLFAPTQNAVEQLESEGIPDERIHHTGNTIVDAVKENAQLAKKKSNILESMGHSENDYVLLTLHRAENVDSKNAFESILEGVQSFSLEYGMPVIYPAHPRSQDRLDEFDITVPECITVIDPVDYLDFLMLEKNTRLIFTDSGGIQEEACILQIPCVTVRTETERPETVEVGGNIVAGIESDAIVEAGKTMIEKSNDWSNPFGDGNSSVRIIDVICE